VVQDAHGVAWRTGRPRAGGQALDIEAEAASMSEQSFNLGDLVTPVVNIAWALPADEFFARRHLYAGTPCIIIEVLGHNGCLGRTLDGKDALIMRLLTSAGEETWLGFNSVRHVASADVTASDDG